MNLHVQGINKRKLLKKDSAQVVQEPPADQERWPWFLNALQELEQVDTAEKADQIASLTQAWLVPADVPLISLYKLSMFFFLILWFAVALTLRCFSSLLATLFLRRRLSATTTTSE